MVRNPPHNRPQNGFVASTGAGAIARYLGVRFKILLPSPLTGLDGLLILINVGATRYVTCYEPSEIDAFQEGVVTVYLVV